jgi:hypothetical protein
VKLSITQEGFVERSYKKSYPNHTKGAENVSKISFTPPPPPPATKVKHCFQLIDFAQLTKIQHNDLKPSTPNIVPVAKKFGN